MIHHALPRLGAALVFAVLVAALGPVAAGASPADDVESGVRGWLAQTGVADATLAVLKDGGVVRTVGFGSWTPDQPQRIASLSKAITGVCVARLIDARKLAFGDTLGAVLAPTFQRLGQPADPKFQAVTIEQLLEHRSGLPRDAVGGNHVDPTASLDDSFKRVLATPLASPPGGDMVYSNIGYLTLGMVVEAVTGQDYQSACRALALVPMGVSAGIDPQLAERAPNGGWMITAADYARFVQVFGRDNHLLNPAIHAWLEARVGAYGMGTFVQRADDGLNFRHTGKLPPPLAGGSATMKLSNGWTAVVIYGGPPQGEDASNALMRTLRTSLGGTVAPG